MKMTQGELLHAKELLKIASAVQFTVFGIPSLYYGDEAGLEGYHDPFCRRTYPWGREDAELLSHYKKLGEIRKDHKAFSGGAFKITHRGNDFIAFERKKGKDRVFVAANAGYQKEIALIGSWRDELSGKVYENKILVDRDAAIILTEM